MLVEDEDESTRARGRGQLPKFGAVVEKIGWLFFRMGCGQKIRTRLIQPTGALFLWRVQIGKGNLATRIRRISTESSQEIQKGGSRWLWVALVMKIKRATDFRGFSPIKQILDDWGRVETRPCEKALSR